MKSTTFLFLVSLDLLVPQDAAAQDSPTAVLPVASNAFFLCPGNRAGATGRDGAVFRQAAIDKSIQQMPHAPLH
ncbi:MAG: hypothetical protein WCK77_19060 [Verrucomicrobiota bacterium]